MIMHQKRYIIEVLKRFKLDQCNSMVVPVEYNEKFDDDGTDEAVDITLYRQLVGCLRFICHSRPEISYGVGVVSRFMSNLKNSHLAIAKRVLRYLKGTLSFGVLFP